jgi:hypothetical protein
VDKPESGTPLVGRSHQSRDFLDGIVNLGFLGGLHVFASKGQVAGEGLRVRTWEGRLSPTGLLWLLDPRSSTHNESRLAACPLSGDQEHKRSCQLILRRVG